MKKDYSLNCGCGWEKYCSILKEAKEMAKHHFESPVECSGVDVLIDESIDYELTGKYWKVLKK